jgi:hypothetical protein
MIFGITLIQKEIQAKEICHCYFYAIILPGPPGNARKKQPLFRERSRPFQGGRSSLLLP